MQKKEKEISFRLVLVLALFAYFAGKKTYKNSGTFYSLENNRNSFSNLNGLRNAPLFSPEKIVRYRPPLLRHHASVWFRSDLPELLPKFFHYAFRSKRANRR